MNELDYTYRFFAIIDSFIGSGCPCNPKLTTHSIAQDDKIDACLLSLFQLNRTPRFVVIHDLNSQSTVGARTIKALRLLLAGYRPISIARVASFPGPETVRLANVLNTRPLQLDLIAFVEVATRVRQLPDIV